MTQYEMRFADLAHHTIRLVPIERERIRRFIDGLNYGLHNSLAQEADKDARFDQVVEIARRLESIRRLEREEWEGKRPRGSGGFSGTSFGGQSQHNRGCPYRTAQMTHPIHRGALVSHDSYNTRTSQSSFSALPAQSSYRAPSVQGSSVPGSSSGYSSSRGPIQGPPSFPARGSCDCGELGHVRKYCPHYYRGPVQQEGQSLILAPVATPPAQPAWGGGRAGRGHPRNGRSDKWWSCSMLCFSRSSRGSCFRVVITCIVSVCHMDASVLFDPRSTYLYVSSYFARYLDTPCDSLVTPIHVSMPMGNSIVVDRVYRSCVAAIGGLETRVDLLLLIMVDLEVILGMDWLSPCHAILDCLAKFVTLAMPRLPRVK
ncbi:uncharacterized protein [Nicotiana tomentosiformis]|uniref:uncharacterized protein n=1 Tax=Nicotiana tomentosiformis TaxID=4098 RepID=UPI00388CD3C4